MREAWPGGVGGSLLDFTVPYLAELDFTNRRSVSSTEVDPAAVVVVTGEVGDTAPREE